MKVEVEVKCDWINKLDHSVYEDNRFNKLLHFYIINTPVTQLSVRSTDLRKHGWRSPWNKKYYLNKQLKDLSTNPRLIYSAKTYNDMDTTLEKSNLKDKFPSDYSYERVAVYNNKRNQFISTFYHIRNSFAHGRFNVYFEENTDDWIFALEDGQKNNSTGLLKVSARMILRMSTLLAWIDLIEGGEKEFEETK